MIQQTMPSPFRLYVEGDLAIKCKQRFVDAFATTWSRLPGCDVDAMTAHIIQMPSKSVEIQLRDEHPGLFLGPSGYASAQFRYHLGDAEIIYRSLFADRLSGGLLQYWIAHELAHLFLNSTNENHRLSYEAAEEEVATLLAGRWGFGKDDESQLRAGLLVFDRASRNKDILPRRR